MKRILYILILLFLLSCEKEYTSYEGMDMIQFSDKSDVDYTFSFFKKDKVLDTLNIGIMTIGNVVDYDRKVKLEIFTKEWEYVYDKDNPKKKIDSSLVNIKFPAEVGKHYNFLNTKNNELLVPKNTNSINLKIEVIRNSDLTVEKRKLSIKLIESNDFMTGMKDRVLKNITISDKLERPKIWSDKNWYCAYYLGPWSEVKHRFMIDSSGDKWDNSYIYKLFYSNDMSAYKDYVLMKIRKALEVYNSNPKNNPPLKDEKGNIVTFPNN